MKKWTIPMLALMSVSALSGCGDKGNFNGTLDKLKNFKLENMQSYKAIGYGSMAEDETQKKGRKGLLGTSAEVMADNELGKAYLYAESGREIATSDKPFYLMGQLDNSEVRRLSFQDGDEKLNIAIDEFLECGNFILFHPTNVDESAYENTTYCLKTYGSGDAENNAFALSKTTGKIYDLRIKDDQNNETLEAYLISSAFAMPDGSMVMLAAIEKTGGIYHFKETASGLEAKFLVSETKTGGLYHDRFGNILFDEKTIISTSDAKLHKIPVSDSKQENIRVDPFNHVFISRSTSENEEDKRCYVFDEKNEFVEVEEAGAYVINGEERVETWPNEKLAEALTLYTKGSRVYTTVGVIDILSKYSYKINKEFSETHIFDEDFCNDVLREDAAYALHNGSIYKYSFEDDGISELDFGNITIMNLSVDEYRRICVTSIDENLEESKGYLDLNDNISFGQIEKPDIVVLTPINQNS